MNDEKYPIWKYILISFIIAFIAWCFFFVKGFAYDLELGNYDFNGFDENADFIFEDFIDNDIDVYGNTEYENLNILKQKLRDNGYTDEYINNFRIKVQTTVNEGYALGSDSSDLSSITELTEENGATDAIIHERNTELSEELQENLYTTEENSTVSTDTQAILDALQDLSDNQLEIQTQLSTLNRLTSENQAYYLQDRAEDEQTIYDKKINDFTVLETLGLIIIFALLGATVVWFIFKFSPHYTR